VNVDINNNIPNVGALHTTFLLQNPVKTQMIITSEAEQVAAVYNLTGNRVLSFTLSSGTNYKDCPLQPGIYLLKINQQTIKFVKQ
jgi:hypothetical protein